MNKEELALLCRMRLFDGFASAELERVIAGLQPKISEFARDAVIWPMGASVFQAGIVLSGRVEAWNYSRDGQGSLVAVHTAGGLFGDVLMSARTVGSPVELRAAQKSRVLFLPLEALLARCASGADAGCVRLLSNLLAEISEKYWALQKRVRCLEIPDGRTRLCVWLLGLRQEQGSAKLHLSFTREQLARRLGMNRCALSRLLGNLQRDRLIVCHGRRIEILDETALAAIAASA